MLQILLDIDGVILPSRSHDPWGHFSVHDWDGDVRMIDEEMRSRVVRLFQLGEVIWCSAWNERSFDLAGALFVPRSSFLPIEIKRNRWAEELDLDSSAWSWKLHSIVNFDDGKSPLIWIDDNIEEDAFLWQSRREAPTLLIRTEESLGLQEEDLEKVALFVDSL